MALLEVCVESVSSAVIAEAGGASRIELCSALALGGLTPSVGLLREVKKAVKIPVFVMIRNRAGNFTYSQAEIGVMKNDLEVLKLNGADGFVYGVLDEEGLVDAETCRALLDIAAPLPCTFHRAFDFVKEPFQALEQIMSLGFQRILTSGQSPTAYEGLPLITQLNQSARSRIKIMAGAGVNDKNAEEIVRRSGVTEIHGSASKTVPCKTSYMNSSPLSLSNEDLYLKETDLDTVKAIVVSINKNT